MGCGSSMDAGLQDQSLLLTKTMSKTTMTDNDSLYLMKTAIENRTINENVQVLQQKKSAKCVQFLANTLMNHFIFYSLNDEVIMGIIQKMFYCCLKTQNNLYIKGASASCFFILERGKLQYEGYTLEKGSTIGEQSLLLNSDKYHNAFAFEDCYFWGLDKTTFISSLDYIMAKQYLQNKQFVTGHSFYSFLTSLQQDGLAQNMIVTKYRPQQIIAQEGDCADSFVIIKSGQAAAYRGNKFLRYLNPRDSFGEKCLSTTTSRTATVKAVTEVQCLVLTREKVKQVLGNNVKKQLHLSVIRNILKQLKTPSLDIEKLLPQFRLHQYNSEPFDNQELNDYIVIVVDGHMKCSEHQYHKGDVISDVYDHQQYVCNGVLAKLEKTKLDLEDYVIEDSLYEFKRVRPQFDELEQWTLIGNSSYGTVFKVEYNEKKYVIRKISRETISQFSLEKQIKQERKILEIINNPFVANFHQYYTDEHNLYFLQDYIQGMNLVDYMQEEGLLDKEHAQFIISQMIFLLETFQNLSIISREFKPNNFIIERSHYIYMIDFKTSKQAYRTHTIIGNPHYMAPEIIEGKGYTSYSDVWSVGVCLFELLCGGVPFGENLDDPYKIYEEILNHQLMFPSFYKDSLGKSLINQLLSINVYERVGSSFDELKAHKWFTIQWDQLQHKQLRLANKKHDSGIKRLSNIDFIERC